MASPPPLPLPIPNPDSQEYWDACKRHELIIQHCSSCQAYRHPPLPTCFKCGSGEWEWVKSSGRGTVYTYTITHHPVHPALKEKVPWTVVSVELEEGVQIVSNLLGTPPDEVKIGMPVEITFETVNEEITLPKFRPISR